MEDSKRNERLELKRALRDESTKREKLESEKKDLEKKVKDKEEKVKDLKNKVKTLEEQLRDGSGKVDKLEYDKKVCDPMRDHCGNSIGNQCQHCSRRS
jgi:septal ring factor EnvC (AmiA/AmiB activator)